MGYIRRPTKAHKTYRVHWMFRGMAREMHGYRSAGTSRQLLRNLERLSETVEVGGSLTDDLAEWIRRGLDDERRQILLRIGLLRQSHVIAGNLLEACLEDWERHLVDCGRTPKYAAGARQQAGWLLAESQAQYWSDIDPERVLAAAADLKAKTSARTAQAYLRSAKTFCKWLARFRGGGRSPLETLAIPAVKDVDLKKRRATLSHAQIEALVRATTDSGFAGGMSGPERALLYRLTMATGMREAGAMGLRRSSFNLERSPATVTVTAKGGKLVQVPLVDPQLVADLRAHLHHKAPEAKAFACPASATWMTQIFKRDLAAAKIEAPPGTSLDFHAMRTTFATRAAEAGVPLEVLQDLMGHTDIRVTRRYYVQVELERKARELQKVCSAVCSEDRQKVQIKGQ